MSDPVVKEIERIEAPFGRKIVLQDVAHESGLRLLRIRIREGTRFTILEIDTDTANVWSKLMGQWAASAAQDGGGGCADGE